MIDCQSAAMTSMCQLLEASGHAVVKVVDAELFSRDILSRRSVRSCDAMIMDVDMGEPMTFRLLNLIMHSSDRPRVVLMVSADAVIGDQDIFSHEKLHILRHPATPQQLLDLLKANP
jgi:CheY-like chemotaxis protein